jgi:hypothetical protein
MRLAAVAFALGVLLAPQAAEACSVCFSGQDQARIAFIATTAFMTALPLIVVGGLVFWLRSRFREAERLETARRQADHGLLPGEPWNRA